MTQSSRDDRLRALLRDADPAAGAPPLPPADLARIRRAAHAALVAPLRSFGWRPLAWAAVAALVLLAVGLAALGRRERATLAPQTTVAAAAARPSAPVASDAAAAPTVAAAPVAAPAAGATPRADRQTSHPTAPFPRTRPIRHPRPAAASAAVAAVAAAPPRQIQLTTPGGTRIVWVLEPSPGR
ncbi:MAG TPA: hypothetical protein VGV61_14455 [Thermoanaerobaculia bacterium]|jgi:uncharacterized iron-regulated membrane protein|nr:hypothetical protein [Thermoanaerobaculia bacterium]